MKDYQFSQKMLIKTIGSSVGVQPKYCDSKYWYKENLRGYEGKAEYLASLVLNYSDADAYVTYEECMINGKKGCISEDFTGSGEIFLSFQKLYSMYMGGELEGKLVSFDTPEQRIRYVKEFVMDSTGLDVSRYLSQILTLDMLILNPDRHMNNLGIISNPSEETYRLAPIFDNGAALLSDLVKYPPNPDVELEVQTESVIGSPFSSSLELQANAAGFGLTIQYDELMSALEAEEECRALKVLKMQLEKYRNIVS